MVAGLVGEGLTRIFVASGAESQELSGQGSDGSLWQSSKVVDPWQFLVCLFLREGASYKKGPLQAFLMETKGIV